MPPTTTITPVAGSTVSPAEMVLIVSTTLPPGPGTVGSPASVSPAPRTEFTNWLALAAKTLRLASTADAIGSELLALMLALAAGVTPTAVFRTDVVFR